ncbi:hypothetical protein R6258_00565 [Halomonas sp. HP20-15]|uniref:hypothetical protein n=1 Tax=Halomonas sp. HP20-15 TaxID=3085901 RepID=UPI0029821D68|nr:hypothetical protein [Halomonas sp. HP20-15]MDW5375397.1 hypothetical protein [Halomonas sp. HP20-15]
MDEREKLRKFRELDDAFAKALKEIETPSKEPANHPQQNFEQRLRVLMGDFKQSDADVNELLKTLLELGRIA